MNINKKNMIKYLKFFLIKIKLFLLYLVKFKENGIIIFKEYLNSYIIRE